MIRKNFDENNNIKAVSNFAFEGQGWYDADKVLPTLIKKAQYFAENIDKNSYNVSINEEKTYDLTLFCIDGFGF